MPTPESVASYRGAMKVLADRTMRQALYDEGGVVMSDVLLTLHGDPHRQRRLLEFKVFRKDFFHYYETQVFPAALEPVMAACEARGGMDLVDFGYRMTVNLTADFAGIDRTAKTPQETETLLRMVKIFSQAATIAHSKMDRNEVRRQATDSLVTLRSDFLQPSIARRNALLRALDEGRITEAELPRDVLTVLLRNEDRLALPDDVVLREMAFYLQAGSHSTANSMVHALHEIFTHCDAHPDDFERVRKDPLFLQRCVHESLRLHPASPVAWRAPDGGCPAGHDGRAATAEPTATAPAGGLVVVELARANRDPGVFGADADVFDPRRRLPSDVPRWGLTFGYGLHMCLGRDLDGGLASNEATDPATHQYGIVTRLIHALLQRNVRRNPEDPPTPDPASERPNWGRYPVLIDRPDKVAA